MTQIIHQYTPNTQGAIISIEVTLPSNGGKKSEICRAIILGKQKLKVKLDSTCKKATNHRSKSD
jgi:hypothetical protein